MVEVRNKLSEIAINKRNNPIVIPKLKNRYENLSISKNYQHRISFKMMTIHTISSIGFLIRLIFIGFGYYYDNSGNEILSSL